MLDMSSQEENKISELQPVGIRKGLPKSVDFFAGSGLVSEALSGFFDTVWANDICSKKRSVFVANHSSDIFHLDSIENVNGDSLPEHELSWASFPCQDLSVAGNQGGITAKRSGMVWEWLRVLDELEERPSVVVAENVVGLVSSKGGDNYVALHEALSNRGYRVGAVLLDAVHWVPQSRPRVFVIGVKDHLDIGAYICSGPTWCHSEAIKQVAKRSHDWVWWNLPKPVGRDFGLESIIEFDAPLDSGTKAEKNLNLIPEPHMLKMLDCVKRGQRVFPGYKRMRKGKQVLELRFDSVAGCLRTPAGGSSRQYVVIHDGNDFGIRLLTVRETARLMGADDSFKLPGTYNDGYRAMGDAVALPAARYLAEHLLSKLVDARAYVKTA